MREILFRGKRIDNGEWAYSQTVFSHLDNFYIPTQNLKCTVMRNLDTVGNISEIRCKDDKCFFKVYSETVGQFTGLTDKNGKKIFEGDIIHLEYSQVFFGGVYFGEYTAEVSYKEGCFITDGINNGDEIETSLSGFDNDELEIIGNIHDNPELLEVTK